MPSLTPAEIQQRLGKIKSPLPARGPLNTLSVCMIVKNEEKNIEAAIRSFLPFADEIVVNDTGSSDKTLEILERLPVKVIQNPWEGDFSKARNQSIDEASSAWILWMDADDRVPPDQVDFFRKLKTAPLDRCFAFQVVNTQAGLALGTRFMQTRMFPNNRALRFERKVHEQIIYSCAKVGLHSFALETQILHTGYEDQSLKRAKAERNISLLMNDPDREIDPILPMQEGDSFAILEKWDEAIESYLFAYNMPDLSNIHRDAFNEIPNCLGRCFMSKGEFNQAIKWFSQGAQNAPDKIEPFYYTGETYFRQNQLDLAEEWFQKALSKTRQFSSVASQYDVMRMYAFNYLCKILSQKLQWKEVKSYAEKFLEEYPQIVEGRLFLGKAHLSLKNFLEAVKYLREGVEMNPKADRSAWQALYFALESAGQSELIPEMQKKEIEAFGSASQVVEASRETSSEATSPQVYDLSVCMIVKNEEKSLPKCLESLKGLNAELVIVDTGSTDKTKEIAQAYGAKLFDFTWCNDFAKARNFSLKQAQGRWILWLDADDVLPEATIKNLMALASKNYDPKKPDKINAYGLLVQNTNDGGVTGSVFNQIRLFPNLPEIEFQGKVHEQLMPSLQRLNISVEFTTYKIFHTGYVNDEVVADKQRRNLQIMQAELQENPQAETSVKIYSIGACYQDLKDWSEAKTWYLKAAQRAERLGEDPHILEMAPLKIAECLAEEGLYDDALNLVEKSLVQYPKNPEMNRLRAQVLEAQGKTPEALAAYLKLLYFQEQVTLFPCDYQLLKFKAIRFLAYYFKNLNKSASLEILKLGQLMQSGEMLSPQKLLTVLFDSDCFVEAAVLLEEGMAFNPQGIDYLNLGKLYILLNEAQKAVNALEEGRKNFPYDDEIKDLYGALMKDLGLLV